MSDHPDNKYYFFSSSEAEKRVWDANFLRQVIDHVADPIFVKDEHHRWIFLNQAYCQFMGQSIEELLGKSDYDFFSPEEADVFWEKDNLVFSTATPDENEEMFTDADGNTHVIVTKKTIFVDSQGRKFLVGVIRDITDRKRLEERLTIAKRLMSLETLAGGMAHEINNPLSYVLANLEYVLEMIEDYPDSELIHQALQASLEGAQRVREIIQDLKAFSHFSKQDLEPIDLTQRLHSTVQIVSQEIRLRAVLIKSYHNVPLIDANARSLDQIFLNLLINASQSLPPSDDGLPRRHEIRVATRIGEHGEAIAEIADTGLGILPQDLPHIFDPFFTTKPVGEGTGLGLAICHTLVETLNGHIEVQSKPGKGSVFRVVFPPSQNQKSFPEESTR